MSPTEPAPTRIASRPATADDPKAVCVRILQIMADGDLGEFGALIHPEAVNREAAREPMPARRRDRPRSTPRLCGCAGHSPICALTSTR
jgi:hypothetical protein